MKYQCKHCPKSFDTFRKLGDHATREHAYDHKFKAHLDTRTGKTVLICGVCGREEKGVLKA